MDVYDIYILGDVTFMGKVVANKWFGGLHKLEKRPEIGDVLQISDPSGSYFEGEFRVVSMTDLSCGGFGAPSTFLMVEPCGAQK